MNYAPATWNVILLKYVIHIEIIWQDIFWIFHWNLFVKYLVTSQFVQSDKLNYEPIIFIKNLINNLARNEYQMTWKTTIIFEDAVKFVNLAPAAK